MAEIIGISLQQEYQKLMAKVQSMEPYLRLLHQDYLLMTTRSFKFIYAVDFYEIWNYAEPIARLMHTDPKDRPLEDAIALEKQIARAELFFGLEPDNQVVLLPPYVIELNRRIGHVK